MITVAQGHNASDAEHEVEEETVSNCHEILDGKGLVRKRKKPLILRWRQFSQTIDDSNFYRELVMLFLLWRNEEDDLLAVNCQIVYNSNKDFIDGNPKNYDKLSDFYNIFNEAIAGYGEAEADDFVLHAAVDDEFRALALQVDNVNVFGDQQQQQRQGTVDEEDVRQFRLPPIVKDTDLLEMVRTLNFKQQL